MVTPNWSSTKLRESMRFDIKTWYLITIQPLSLSASTLAMCSPPEYKGRCISCARGYIGFANDTTYRLTVATRHLFCPKYDLEVSEVHTTSTNFEPKDWQFPIIDYALHSILPDDPKEAAFVRQRSTRFYYSVVVKMYHYSYDGILLHCLSSSKAWEVLKEAHDSICGAHQPGPKLKDRLHRLVYYWPTMIADAVEYARRCKACQIHADFIQQSPELLHPTVASWLFEAWGIHLIGPISPPSVKDHQFILTITD